MVKHCSIHGDHNEEKCPKCEVTYMEKALKDRLSSTTESTTTTPNDTYNK